MQNCKFHSIDVSFFIHCLIRFDVNIMNIEHMIIQTNLIIIIDVFFLQILQNSDIIS